MGIICCKRRNPDQVQIQNHMKSNCHTNDQQFLTIFKFQLSELFQEVKQTQNVKPLERDLQQVQKQLQEVKHHLKQVELQAKELKKKPGWYQQQSLLNIEIRKAHGIPNTSKCCNSQPFAVIKVKPLEENSTTNLSDSVIPKWFHFAQFFGERQQFKRLEITVYNKDLNQNVEVGSVKLDISKLPEQPSSKWFGLKIESESVLQKLQSVIPEIELKLQFLPNQLEN